MNTTLTTEERKLLSMMSVGTLSDRKICVAMNLTLGGTIRVAACIRAKLGLADGATLRGVTLP